MTLRLYILGILIVGCVVADAQKYFQQQVDYAIDVSLDPQTHTLTASGSITYHNNSEQSLDSLPLHLWANAYSSRHSPFAEQLRRHDDVRFAFAEDAELGGYTSLEVSGSAVHTSRYENVELLWVVLQTALEPQDSVSINLDYTLRVPSSFSRMGRDEFDGYQITQWYPKVALFDQDGWHTMPYLDAGEYFNDFGNYIINVTVPSNGVVAATGTLLPSPGLDFRNQRILSSATSDTVRIDTLTYGRGTTTYPYVATNVTDFAWFVDPRFRVAQAKASLADRNIPSYAYYIGDVADQWRDAAALLARAASFGDSLVGRYPYAQISAVYAALGAGGGMEYPMITVINRTNTIKQLDEVLAHEAFHNWFALHLASNERDHPWLDEGFTTWLEQRYMQRYYKASDNSFDGLPKAFLGSSAYSPAAFLHSVLAKSRRNPTVNSVSDSLPLFDYGYAAYTQPGALLELLETRVGRERFDAAMATYVETWGGRHPSPSTVKAALPWEEAGVDFDAFFNGREVPDYKIKSARYDESGLLLIDIVNKSNVAGPLIISTKLKGANYQEAANLNGFTGRQTFQLSTPGKADVVAIDPDVLTPEVERHDNYRRIGKAFGGIRPLAVDVLPQVGDPARNNLGIIPTFSFNAADRFLLGVGLHNYTGDVGALRYFFAPQLNTRDGALNGLGMLAYSFYKLDSWWREIELKVSGRSYGYAYSDSYSANPRFSRTTLSANLLLASKPGLHNDHRVGIQSHFIDQKFVRGINVERGEFEIQERQYTVFEATYTFQHRDPITPWNTKFALEGNSDCGRASATVDYALRYRQEANFVRVRAFAGAFAFRQNPAFRALLLPNGTTGFGRQQNDYLFQQNLLNRAETSNQYFVRDGSLTLPFVLPQASSDTWLTSVSASVDAPLNSPFALSLYGDVAIYPDARPNGSGVLSPATAGVRLSLPYGIGSVSFPFYNSSFVKEALVFTQVDPKYRERIAFQLDLSRIDPDEVLRWIRK